MARIRTIKPEFPQSETIGKLSRDARLLFVQLWTIVDDDGRSRASSRLLASLLYPYDNDAPKLMDKWLDELEANECIRRYEAEGNAYLDIPNWQKHQKIDRPSKSRLPEHREVSTHPREDSRASDADLGPSTMDLGPRTKKEPRASALDVPFDQFWEAYPHKVGKQAAIKALGKILKSGRVTFEELMAGLHRYATKTDDRPWCNPATFLNEGRWEDQPAVGDNRNGKRSHQSGERRNGGDYLAGIAKVAEAIVGDRPVAGPADEEIPLGRVNIDADRT